MVRCRWWGWVELVCFDIIVWLSSGVCVLCFCVFLEFLWVCSFFVVLFWMVLFIV